MRVERSAASDTGLVRVTVAWRGRRADLCLPSVVPVADILPELARHVGALEVGTVQAWCRAVTRNGVVLRPDLGLGPQGVAHGEVITLVPPAGEPTADPHDDVSEAVAEVVERDVLRWDPAAGRQVAFRTAVLLLLLGAGALSSRHGTHGADGAGALAAAATVALLVGAIRVGAIPGETLRAVLAGHLSCLYAAVAVLCWSWRTPVSGAVPGAPVTLAGGAVCATALAAVLGTRSGRLLLLPAVAAGTVCAAAGLVMQTTPLDPALPLTTLLTLVVLATSGLPTLALSTSGAGRHALSVAPSLSGVDRSGTDEPGTDWTGIDMDRLTADCRLAREILVAVSASAGTLLVLLAPFAVSLGRVGVAVPLLGSAVMILRTRRYRSADDVRVGLLSGILGLLSTALSVLLLEPDSRLPAAAVAVAAGVVLLGRTPRACPGDRQPGRVGDWAESAALVALVPALVVAAGLSVT
jgi:ESX secretion system protein EccD